MGDPPWKSARLPSSGQTGCLLLDFVFFGFCMFLNLILENNTICRPKISPPKVIYKVQSMPYKSLPLGAFWTIFGRNSPTGVPELLYPYQPANPLVESIFKALKIFKKKGLHTRTAIGVNSLPLNASVEIDAIFLTK